MQPGRFLPPSLPEVIPRTRLLEQLDAARQKRLILIHAPAGQGKTTLLAQHLARHRHRAAWYSLTEEDGDPARFLATLARAFAAIFPGHAIEPLPTPMQSSLPLDREVALRRWAAHLWAQIPEACCLVLDDYHRLPEKSAVHRIMEVLLDGMPAHIAFAVLSRTPPAFRYTSLLAKRAVTELTALDLAATRDETGRIAQLMLHRPPAPEEVEPLWRCCEGWIAGVVLMTHAFHQKSTPGSSSPVFPPRGARAGEIPGRDLLFDYLAREVFEQLSSSTRDLLCRTSILESVPVPLAGALSANPRAREVLVGLQRDNLLTTALDAEGTVFRYHPLFREFLRARFKAVFPARRRQAMHRAAARYHERQEDPEQAVRLYLEAGDFHRAVRLIEKLGLPLMRQGKKQTLLGWIEALPPRLRGSRPRLIFFQGLASMLEDPAGSKKLLRRALAAFRRRGDLVDQAVCVGALIEIQTLLSTDFGRIPPLTRIAGRLLGRLSGIKSAADLRAFLLCQLGLSYFLVLGRFSEAGPLLEESLKVSQRMGGLTEQAHTLTYLTWCACYGGELDRARDYVGRALTLLGRAESRQEWEPMAWMAKGVVCAFEGRCAEGLEAVAQAERLTAELGTTSVQPYNLTAKGFLLMETGRLEESRRCLETSRQMAEQVRHRWFEFLNGMFLTKLHLVSGDLAAAHDEAQRLLKLGEISGGRFFYSWGAVLTGMVEGERRRFGAARRHLERALRIAREMKTDLLEATIHLAVARIEFARGRTNQGRARLERGFHLCAARDAPFYPLWYPAFVTQACSQALRHDICPDYAARLLTRHPPNEAPSSLLALARDADRRVRQAARAALQDLHRDVRPPLRIHTLGGFRVSRGEELIPDDLWQGKQLKNLLKLLVALGGIKVSQEVVMETLWPENDPDASAGNLRSLLSRLRHLVEPDLEAGLESSYLHCKEGLLSLDPKRCWVDAQEFHHRLEEGKRKEREQRPGEALPIYLEAERLYGGEFLPEDRNEDWVLPVRERILSQYLDLLRRIARLKEDHQEWEELPGWYRKLLAKDPLQEAAYRGLMRSQHRIGRRAEALRAYQECREKLIAELGVEPAEETTALYRKIREDPGLSG